MSSEFIQEIINEIIFDTFTHPLPIKYQGNDYIKVSFNSINFNQYKTLLQGGNNLCGFYSLFNLIHFIKYKKSNDAIKHLQSMNSRWKFWRFYNNTINKLLSEMKIEASGQKSLLSNGPLERYQFNYLIKQSMLFNSANEIDIELVTFFYAFGLFHCTNKEDVKRNQGLIDQFISETDETDNKNRFLVVLMGIVNHWNILVIEKMPKSKHEGSLKYYFIDARNIDVLSIKEDDIDTYSQKMIDYLNTFNRVPSQWWKKCFGQWIRDMHKAMKIIIDLIQSEISLFDIYFNDTIGLMLNNFESYNSVNLNNDQKKEEFIETKPKVLKWMREEYHPTVADEELIKGIEVFEYNQRIKQLAFYDKFTKWITIMEKTINEYRVNLHNGLINDNHCYNKENKIKAKEENELIDKYKEIIDTLKRLLKL